MPFTVTDYVVIAAYVLAMVVVAVIAKRRSQDTLEDFFTGGKDLPWWLVGISMVATTFAADTPLAITGIIATEGLAGNWIWWNFMFSGLITVFIYAKLWKRADVITDVEFIELRYGGRPAEILRGFRALYLALPINCIILGWVTVGMAKLMMIVTGAELWIVITLLYVLTGIYIAISGIWGVVVTDFLQFFVAMGGTILLAIFSVNHVGGLDGLQQKLAMEYGSGHTILQYSPFSNPEILITTALVWVGMMWWASWYPGAEPGGGGYIAQRMFSARNEQHAVGGTLLFNIMHYAVRPWPWILVALVSLVVYPGIEDKETGYPLLMLKLLPSGLLGLLCVAFLSAFVSTVSTHLNWGASYIVNDFYKRFIKPESDFTNTDRAQKHYVWVSRLATLLIMALAIVVSYFFDTVKGGWQAILSLGAGTGLVFMLRWFWWRINAWSEIAAMSIAAISSASAYYLGYDDFGGSMIFTTVVTTIGWLAITYATKPESDETLRNYFNKVKPFGKGWKRVTDVPLPGFSGLGHLFIQIAASAIAINISLYGMKVLFFDSVVIGFGYLTGAVLILAWVVHGLRDDG